MEYREQVADATKLSGQALALMARHGIAPHPNNFTVWYCHVSGQWPELSRTLNTLVESGEPLSEERSAAVYKAFCASPYDGLPLHMLAERMETELSVVLGALEQAGRGAREYGKSLALVAEEVTTAQSEIAVRKIIGHLLAQTRAMATQSRQVEQRLEASSLEIGALKAELAGARRQALSDALTGLANRRMFEYALRDASLDAVDAGTPMSVMLIDIDHFKKFNDDFGHLVGDHVLKLLAVVLRENVKGKDTAARYGGEEFAVVLPQTKGCDAGKVADSIRKNLSTRKLFNRKTGEALSKISVSIGVAEFNREETLSQFIERVDQALYFAKRNGRNQVVVEEEMRAKLAIAF